MFLIDEGDAFEASREEVWSLVGSGDEHSRAHHHRAVRRTSHGERSGTYSWEQEFDGATVRFGMRWTSFHPVGIAYEVVEGPFEGSKLFLYYTPDGERTRVTVAGEFVSPKIPDSGLAAAVDRFLAREFEQDNAALRARRAGRT